MNPVHLSRVDLNLFVIFDAIFMEGGVTPAARRLNLSQPAISHALVRLRELFDDPLFVRRGQAMVPTQRARQMIEPVRAALQSLEATTARRAEFDPATASGGFVLGLQEAIETTIMPGVLAQIAAAAPGIDISMIRVDRRRMKSELSDGSVDAVVDIGRPVSGELRSAPFASYRLAVVARQGHPDIGRDLDLDTYLRQGHILVTARRHGLGVEDYALHAAGHRRRIKVRCQHHYAACRMVAATDYLMTLPEHYAHAVNGDVGNLILPFPLAASELRVHLYWHAQTDDDPASLWLREQLLAAAEPPASAGRRV